MGICFEVSVPVVPTLRPNYKQMFGLRKSQIYLQKQLTLYEE